MTDKAPASQQLFLAKLEATVQCIVQLREYANFAFRLRIRAVEFPRHRTGNLSGPGLHLSCAYLYCGPTFLEHMSSEAGGHNLFNFV